MYYLLDNLLRTHQNMQRKTGKKLETFSFSGGK